MSILDPKNGLESVLFLLTHPVEVAVEVRAVAKYAKELLKNRYEEPRADCKYHFISKGGWGQTKTLPGIPPVDKYLSNLGIAIHKFGYNTFQDIEKSVDELSDYIQELKKKYKVDKFGLVGFSEGTIVDALYIVRTNGKYVSHLIAIAPPYGGTRLAEIEPFTKSAKQMRPDSEIIRLIKKKLVPIMKKKRIAGINLFAGHDTAILPIHKSKIPGIRNRYIDTTHTEITMNPITYEEIGKWLKEFLDPDLPEKYLKTY
jgi:hypothetical protein